MMQYIIGTGKYDQQLNRRMGFKDRLKQGRAAPARTKRLVMDGISPPQVFCNHLSICEQDNYFATTTLPGRKTRVEGIG